MELSHNHCIYLLLSYLPNTYISFFYVRCMGLSVGIEKSRWQSYSPLCGLSGSPNIIWSFLRTFLVRPFDLEYKFSLCKVHQIKMRFFSSHLFTLPCLLSKKQFKYCWTNECLNSLLIHSNHLISYDMVYFINYCNKNL